MGRTTTGGCLELSPACFDLGTYILGSRRRGPKSLNQSALFLGFPNHTEIKHKALTFLYTVPHTPFSFLCICDSSVTLLLLPWGSCTILFTESSQPILSFTLCFNKDVKPCTSVTEELSTPSSAHLPPRAQALVGTALSAVPTACPSGTSCWHHSPCSL